MQSDATKLAVDAKYNDNVKTDWSVKKGALENTKTT